MIYKIVPNCAVSQANFIVNQAISTEFSTEGQAHQSARDIARTYGIPVYVCLVLGEHYMSVSFRGGDEI